MHSDTSEHMGCLSQSLERVQLHSFLSVRFWNAPARWSSVTPSGAPSSSLPASDLRSVERQASSIKVRIQAGTCVQTCVRCVPVIDQRDGRQGDAPFHQSTSVVASSLSDGVAGIVSSTIRQVPLRASECLPPSGSKRQRGGKNAQPYRSPGRE